MSPVVGVNNPYGLIQKAGKKTIKIVAKSRRTRIKNKSKKYRTKRKTKKRHNKHFK